MPIVRPATLDDIDQWLEIACEVEPLFGAMPDLAKHIRGGISRGTALVLCTGRRVNGACLLSRDDGAHEIYWLAVRQQDRRRRFGSMLLDAIESRWPTGYISVVTFDASIAGGWPARRLYESHGFECRGHAEPAANGDARDVYVLPAMKRLRR